MADSAIQTNNGGDTTTPVNTTGTTPTANNTTAPANTATPTNTGTTPTNPTPPLGIIIPPDILTKPLSNPPTPEDPPVESHPFFRSSQDAEEAAAINTVRKLVGIIMKDPDMDPVRKKGFDNQTLTTTLGLCDTADDKFDARQVAIAAQLGRTNTLAQLFTEGAKVYADFRETARTAFSDPASLKALKVSDPVPDALANFLTDARSAYTTAKTEPYTTVLSKKGYSPVILDQHLADLKVLSDADEEQARLIGDAQKATTARRDAVTPVQKFRSDLMRVARRVFRKEPEKLAKLDF